MSENNVGEIDGEYIYNLGLIVVSLLINLSVSLLCFFLIGKTIGKIMFLFWVISLLTSVIYILTRSRFIGILAKLEFFIFFPIGMIGCHGINQTMNMGSIIKIENEDIARPIERENSDPDIKPVMEFYYNRSQLNIYLIIGSIGLFVFILTLISGKVNANGILILPLIMYLTSKNFKPVKIFENHIEIKNGTLCSTEVVKTSDIKFIENVGNRKLFINRNDNTIVKIHLNLLNNDERTYLERTLNDFVI